MGLRNGLHKYKTYFQAETSIYGFSPLSTFIACILSCRGVEMRAVKMVLQV
jgi:hypothetical protein